MLVIIKGGGELGTGVALRLLSESFKVIITEINKPVAERRLVCFAEAVYEGEYCIGGITAKRVENIEACLKMFSEGKIPLIVDPEAKLVETLRPNVVVDARMAKRNLGTRITEAPIVIGLGPGFRAGIDVHAVIETKPGLEMGKIIFEGEAISDDKVPYPLAGYTFERLLVSPASGRFKALKRIGERIKAGDVVGLVEGKPVISRISGVIYGLVHDGVRVGAGRKIGDIIPDEAFAEYRPWRLRETADKPYATLSERAVAVAEGVLKAIRILQSKNK